MQLRGIWITSPLLFLKPDKHSTDMIPLPEQGGSVSTDLSDSSHEN